MWLVADGAGHGLPRAEDKLAIKRLPRGESYPVPAFTSRSPLPTATAVDAFHREALAHGGADLGAPGLRPQYGPGYYAAFVADPAGHRLEAACHESSRAG